MAAVQQAIGPTQARTIFDPERSCDTVLSFAAALTGDIHLAPANSGTWVAVWTPTKGKRFRLKGWRVQAVVTTALAGSAGTYDALAFFDNNGTSEAKSAKDIVAYASAPFERTAAAGTVLTFACAAQEIPGRLSRAANNGLYVGATGSSGIGAGNISVFGEVWGTEE